MQLTDVVVREKDQRSNGSKSVLVFGYFREGGQERLLKANI